ncbi:two-component system, cell cycle response regulator DivK [Desulfatibacillum alkenivorans DSM 16219]|jgi:two-component system cell cycle response regulator DivK|uniref:Two-component system, cell cycle response regulator DivK n=1 Tax=Desulfatibacillum alkenivorans DSM 16219 TaxID=1121393 RepID=A0A1M6GGY0_9BACT|nr:response regulator [Desulfatibacillum alkenivorans]SHJ09197.1 two-component system, cell cycle response regulator DivK [Desulfatibacillum alkenivorans DSM 16219]
MEKQVLVVEDSETNRVLLHDLLEKVCYCSVSVAANGKQGLEMAQADLPDLILMDLGLPLLDGMEATKILKSDAKTGAIPIIALTGFVSNEDEERMMDAGFDGFLPKPFDVRKLLDKVCLYLTARENLQL